MKNLFFLILIVFLQGCGGARSPRRIPADWSTWKQTTNVELNYPIAGHKNNYRKIYINPTGEEVSVTNKNGRTSYNYPEGTIVLKEIYPHQEYTPGDKPFMLTVMIKESEHEKAMGGWLWMTKVLDTGKEAVVPSDFCFKCHQDANGPNPEGDNNPEDEFRDYLFFPFIREK